MGVSIGVNKIQRKIPMFAFDLQKCFARTNQGRFVNSLCQNIIESFEKEKKCFSDIGKDAKLLPAGKKIKTDIWMFYVYPGVNLAGVEPDRVKLSISSHVTRGPNAKS